MSHTKGTDDEPGHDLKCAQCGQRYIGTGGCGPSHAIIAAEIERAPYLAAALMREREDVSGKIAALAAAVVRADRNLDKARDANRACIKYWNRADAAEARAADLAEQLAAVEKLHLTIVGNNGPVCVTCQREAPCMTARAAAHPVTDDEEAER